MQCAEVRVQEEGGEREREDRGGINKYSKTYSAEQLVNDAECDTDSDSRIEEAAEQNLNVL
jgi:hypothetical protein